jgi:hypothetical protein
MAALDLGQQYDYFNYVYECATDVLDNRAKDYAPGGAPLLNVLDTCVRRKLTPSQVLGVLLDKQTTALDRFFKHDGRLDSDSLRSRTIDALNYHVFMLFWVERRADICEAWRVYWDAQPNSQRKSKTLQTIDRLRQL